MPRKIVPNLQREGAAEWIKASSDLQQVPKKFNSTAANPGECLFTPKFTINPMNCKKNTSQLFKPHPANQKTTNDSTAKLNVRRM